MGTYTKRNLRDVENQALKFDMPDEMEARYSGQEAVYVMVRGSAYLPALTNIEVGR